MTQTNKNQGPRHEETEVQANPAVAQAVQEYRAAQARGKKPNRQEFLARYGELAGEIGACLDALDFLQGAAQGFPGVKAQGEASPTGEGKS